MTAGEHQSETIVDQLGVGDVFEWVGGHWGLGQQVLFAGKRAVASDSVNCLVAGGRDQPRGGIDREPVASPAGQRDEPGLLQGILGRVEIPQQSHQSGQRPAPHLAVEPGGGRIEVVSSLAR